MHTLALLFVHDSLSMYITYTVIMNTVDEVYELSMVHRSPARNGSTPNCPVPMGTFFWQTLLILFYLSFSWSEKFLGHSANPQNKFHFDGFEAGELLTCSRQV